jgi:hypothetical protein
MRLRRRRPLYRWSPHQIAEQVEASYVISSGLDTEEPSIRATLVFEQNPELMPRRPVREGRGAGDFYRYLVFEFFAGVHEMATRNGGFESTLEQVRGHDSLTEAIADARHQLPEGREVQFYELPRLIRSALIYEVSGRLPATKEWLAEEVEARQPRWPRTRPIQGSAGRGAGPTASP